MCNQLNITAADIFNFDEVGFRVGMSSGEQVIVPTDVKEVSYIYIILYMIVF